MRRSYAGRHAAATIAPSPNLVPKEVSLLDHLIQRAGKAVPVTPLSEKRLPTWLKEQSAQLQSWLKAAGFKAKPGSWCLVPDGRGQPAR